MDGSNSKDIYFDPKNEDHQDWLRRWCKAHWLPLFKRSLVYGNKLAYEICCNSFSRRAFIKVGGHPPLMSIAVLKIPGLRNATCYEDLYRWLLEIMTEATRQGQKVFFPSLNRYHVDREEQDDAEEPQTEQERLLAKRNADLQTELDQRLRTIIELKKHNEQLLQSTKSWHSKYEQLLDNSTNLMTLITPKKQRDLDLYNFSVD